MSDRVTFTKDSAERIARVVRLVEAGNRDTSALPTAPRLGGGGGKLRLGTFTGNWQTATYTTVTLHGSTQTVSVYNWCNPALGASTSNTSQSRYVIFGGIKGTNSAVEIQMLPSTGTCSITIGGVNLAGLPGYNATQKQVLGHSDAGCLTWFSVTTCSQS